MESEFQSVQHNPLTVTGEHNSPPLFNKHWMIVIISPTHAQFTSLLYTLAYMFRPLRAIISQSTEGHTRLNMNHVLQDKI
jgi:hypothetical protein